MKKRTIASIIFSAALLIGAGVCLICDLAISGRLTWSLIPAASIAFAWIIVFPCLRWGKKGVIAGLILLGVLLVPYLRLLSVLTGVREVYTVGTAMSAVSVAFLWIAAAVFGLAGRKRLTTAAGIVCALAVPLVFAVNFFLSRLIGEPLFDIWDLLTVLLLLVLACVLCLAGTRAGRRKQKG